MGLRDLLSRWSRGEDERTLARAEEESRMSAHERDLDREDFEARKDDIAADVRAPGVEDSALAEFDPPKS